MAEELRNFMVHYSDTGANIRLPTCFLQKWGFNLEKKVKLMNRDGRLWIIGLERHAGDVSLGSHWTEFKNSHDISPGDSVYFMYRASNLFNVVIFGLNGLEKMVRRRVSTEKTKRHFFKKLVNRSFGSRLVLPDSFSYSFGKLLANPVTLFPGSTTKGWKVSWSSDENIISIAFEGGWSDFVNMHKLELNDILVFYFNQTYVLPVEFIRSESGLMVGFSNEIAAAPVNGPIRKLELWTSELTAAAAKKGKPLYVPAKVASTTFKNRPVTVTMRVPSGGTEEWHLIWSQGRKECKFGKGWYEFKESNNLTDGAFLTFGQIQEENLYYVEVVNGRSIGL